jgi:hypothetical protein
MRKNSAFFPTTRLFLTMWLITSYALAQKPSASSLEITGVKALPFLLEKNNTEFQPIQVKTKFLTDSCLATAYVDGNYSFSFYLKKGGNNIEVPMKAMASNTVIQLRIELKGMPSYQASEHAVMLSGIYPDQPQVIVTAFKPCDDGKGRLLTFSNSSAATVKTKLVFGNNTSHNIWTSNADEDKIKETSSNMEIYAWGGDCHSDRISFSAYNFF